MAAAPASGSSADLPAGWEARGDWRSRYRWPLLLGATRVAADPRLLVLGAIGLALTVGGWWVLGQIFKNTDEPAARASIELLGSGDWALRTSAPQTTSVAADLPGGISGATTVYAPGARWLPLSPFVGTWHLLTRPFQHALAPRSGVVGFTFALLCGLWGVTIWSFFGAAICRIAAARLARDERVTLRQAIRHATTKCGAYFWAPVFPLVGVLLVALPLAAIGWAFRYDAGILAAAILWPLALVAGLLMTIFTVGLYFGWPLMWATIATEGTDSFDALSRTYAYVYQRPLHYLVYGLIVTVVGFLAALVAQMFAIGVVYLSLWGASWTSGEPQMQALRSHLPSLAAEFQWFDPAAIAIEPAGAPPRELSQVGQIGVRVLGFWIDCVRYLALGFGVAYFWASATGIYLLLRKEVDNTEVDSVRLDGEETQYGLPPLARDEAGVPMVADDESAEGANGSGAKVENVERASAE